MTTTNQLLATFWVGETRWAIDALQVQEILMNQPMVPVPRAEPSICGLINLRGQVVTSISLAERMGLGAQRSTEPPFSVVVRTADGPVSLLVDNVGEVLNTSELRLDQPPDTLDERLRELVTGVYQLEDSLLLRLDVVRATEVRAHSGSPEQASAREAEMVASE